MKDHNKLIRTIVVIAAVVIIGWLLFSAYRYFFTFYVTSTNPRTSSVSSIAPYIDVNFNKTLEKTDNFTAYTYPENYMQTEIKGKTIRVYLEEMPIGNKYEIRIPLVRATDGKELQNVSIKFTAKDIALEKLSKEQQDYLMQKQDEKSEVSRDPILSYIPYGGLDFELNPIITTNDQNQEVVTVEAKLLLSAADARTDANAAAEQYKKEALDYLISKGIDPTKYTITYEVVKPTF